VRRIWISSHWTDAAAGILCYAFVLAEVFDFSFDASGAMFRIHLQPDLRQLRQFGFIAVVAVPLIVWLWSRDTSAVLWSLPVSVLAGTLALFSPRALLPVFVGLTLVTIPIGLVVGELCLLLVYFGLMVPIGCIFKLIGRDALELSESPDQRTFWRPRHPPRDIRQYYRQS
jgi:hypothetical protein